MAHSATISMKTAARKAKRRDVVRGLGVINGKLRGFAARDEILHND